MKHIKKAFAEGISEDVANEVQTRRDAYCLSLGISLDFLREH